MSKCLLHYCCWLDDVEHPEDFYDVMLSYLYALITYSLYIHSKANVLLSKYFHIANNIKLNISKFINCPGYWVIGISAISQIPLKDISTDRGLDCGADERLMFYGMPYDHHAFHDLVMSTGLRLHLTVHKELKNLDKCLGKSIDSDCIFLYI